MDPPAQDYVTNNSVQRRDCSHTLQKFIPHLTWRDDENVLDVGCGSGDVTHDILRPSLPASYSRCLVGVDISPKMIDYAKSNYGDTIEFYCMDIATSDENPRQIFSRGFHKIFSNYCLHWVKDQKRVMRNLFELLEPGGEMVLLLVASHPMFQSFDRIIERPNWLPYFEINSARRPMPYDRNERPGEELRKNLESAGFVVKHCDCIDLEYIFKNIDSFRKFADVLSPFEIPSDLYQGFLTEWVDDIDVEKLENGTVVYRYKSLEALVSKP